MEPVLNNEEKLALQNRFKIEIKEANFICRSINDTFRLDCGGKKLALRRSSTNPYYGLEETDFEYDVLMDLNKEEDLQVIVPFSRAEKIGDQIYFLTFWIDGETTSAFNSSPEKIGLYLGGLHTYLKKIKRSPSKPFSAGYIDDIILRASSSYLDFKRYYPYSANLQTRERLTYLENIVGKLRVSANVWGDKLNQKQIVHGGPRYENFISSDKGLIALDFQGMRHDYVLADLGWCLTTSLCEHNGYGVNLTIAEEFLRGYFSTNPLVDLSSFIEVTKLRHLRSLDTIYYFRLFEKKDKPELFETEERSVRAIEDLEIKRGKIQRIIKKCLGPAHKK